MPGIPRKTALILGGNSIGSPSGIFETFGSLKAGTPTPSSDLAAIQNAAWLQGWAAGALVQTPNGENSPAIQDFAAFCLTVTQQIAYLLSRGVPEWDPTGQTIYNQGDICRRGPTNVAGRQYIQQQCQADGITSDPLTDTTNWKPYTSSSSGGGGVGILQAKVCFNGTGGVGPCSIYGTPFNVASVNKVAVGTYLINFAANLIDANYAWSASAGEPNGATGGLGNYVCGAVFGIVSIKTQASLLILCAESTPNQLVDSSAISVLVA